MQPWVYCTPKNATHQFFLVLKDETYYLFSQTARKSVYGYFGKGVPLHKALDFSCSKRDSAVLHTIEKLPMYIRYIEREYSITVLEQTRKRSDKKHRKENECNLQHDFYDGCA